jgi:SAM-dependent methyltransferase
MPARPHYTFGDESIAELRLRRLATLFAPSSAALLGSLSPPAPQRVLDVGCGPGFTAALLADTFPEASVLGMEASERFVAAASREQPAGRLRFACGDATAGPLPGAPFDLIYARFLLAHLSDPGAALRTWRDAAAPQGRLVCEELAVLTSTDPLVQRYYDTVEAMQRHYGQRFDIGRALDEIATTAGWRVERFAVRRLDLDVPRLLELHALNVRSWRADPFVQATCTGGDLDAIQRRLDDVARGAVEPPRVEYRLGQLVARRPDQSDPAG